jgi:DNA-binding transcriptional ArsR family regulator
VSRDDADRGAVPLLLDAGALAGLLADPHRRVVVAALVLGAHSFEEITAATGLDARAAGRAVTRLVDAGLVERAADSTLTLLAEAFALAARASAPTDPQRSDLGDDDPDTAKVLRAFVRDGRLTSIPASRTKRLVVLDLLAHEFEPGERYSEAMVNLMLGKWHADTAALRRYLVDEGFLDRDAGQYWRMGGSVAT